MADLDLCQLRAADDQAGHDQGQIGPICHADAANARGGNFAGTFGNGPVFLTVEPVDNPAGQDAHDKGQGGQDDDSRIGPRRDQQEGRVPPHGGGQGRNHRTEPPHVS